jgi:ectoine hydroxylase-related dioxygenase (phytanoyl-CoA dioxygenase family)
MLKSYGLQRNGAAQSDCDKFVEQIRYRGYAVLENCLDADQVSYASAAAQRIYADQEKSFGKERLAEINELDMARAPLLTDRFFIDKMVLNTKVREVVNRLIVGPYQIHLQNAIINRPQSIHHQSSWHRDLPYQNWVCSQVLALSAFFCLCDFTSENGATWVLPYSHMFEEIPSDEYLLANRQQMIAPAGSVVLFNSMLLHCAGSNVSQNLRIGVNNIYTIPLIKQQIDLTEAIEASGQKLTPEERVLLGVEYASASSVTAWRENRVARKVKS